jgi:hypothetical protein
MPILQLLTTSAGYFDPEATKILTAAYDTAWQMLKTSGNVLAADFRAASTRELLAKRIIETGSQGERDPFRLAEDALAHLQIQTETASRGAPPDEIEAARK